MSQNDAAEKYIGLIVIVLLAIAIYGLYNVWNYILTPGPSNSQYYAFNMSITVASTFFLALLFVTYSTYKRHGKKKS
ncbi:MAG TPA: hypothetical protein ENJ59_01875 [Thermofilum sp.]|nr:hypothetical protein [Thermofilum sp.]